MALKNKSLMPYPLLISLIKELVHIMIIQITRIICKSLSTGSFPDVWKTRLVTPLIKKQGLDSFFLTIDQ